MSSIEKSPKNDNLFNWVIEELPEGTPFTADDINDITSNKVTKNDIVNWFARIPTESEYNGRSKVVKKIHSNDIITIRIPTQDQEDINNDIGFLIP